MKGKVQGGVVLMLLVAFPILSWYYLKGGIDYRKEVLKELEYKVPIDTTLFDSFQIELIRNKVVVLDLHGDTAYTNKVYDQFKNTKDYFKLLSTSGVGGDSVSNELHKKLETLVDTMAYVLIDGQGNIRRKYSNTDDDIKLMIKHVASLIPFVETRRRRDTESSNSLKK